MAQSHYVSSKGEVLEGYEKGYAVLQSYFGEAVPKKITVEFKDNESNYNNRWNTITLKAPNKNAFSICHIAFMSSHLALFNFADEAPQREEFRFLYGFSDLIKSESCDALKEYKQWAIRTTNDISKDKGISFEKMQDWSSLQTQIGDRSYQVGGSFMLYIIDTYGKDKLLAFFKAVGDSKNLDKALQASLGKDKATIEKEWLTYIAQDLPVRSTPKIVRFSPANNAKNVPLDLTEIEVEFDQAMGDRHSFGNDIDCDAGVCGKDGYWKTTRIFAVKTTFKPDYDYNLGFGSANKQNFRSFLGISLPVQSWQFKTAAK